jgi:hypothetical protein
MGDYIWLRFFLQTLEEFSNIERWQSFFAILQEKGYHLHSYDTGSDAIIPELQTAMQEQNNDFSIDADGPLEFRIDFHPEEGYLQFSIEAENQFPNDEQGFAAYQSWLELLKEMYSFLQPLIVYQFNESRYNIEREDILARTYLNWLYDIAIYSPPLVETIGRERLLSAPAWRVEAFDDGAVLLVPEEHYYLPIVHNYTVVATHLGFHVPEPSDE